MELNKKAIGQRIKSIRKAKGLTMEEFGRLFDNASKGVVSNWESGSNIPNNARLKMIAQFGGIPVDELLYGDRSSMIASILNSKFLEVLNRFDYPEDEIGMRFHNFLLDNELVIKQQIIDHFNSSSRNTLNIDQITDQIEVMVFSTISESPENNEELLHEVIIRLDRIMKWIDAAYGKSKIPFVVPNERLAIEIHEQLTNSLQVAKKKVERLLDKNNKGDFL